MSAQDYIRFLHNSLYAGELVVANPFFHCWFLSLPHVLVLLSEVTDAASFWGALLQTRSIVSGAQDYYFELARIRRWKSAG